MTEFHRRRARVGGGFSWYCQLPATHWATEPAPNGWHLVYMRWPHWWLVGHHLRIELHTQSLDTAMDRAGIVQAALEQGATADTLGQHLGWSRPGIQVNAHTCARCGRVGTAGFTLASGENSRSTPTMHCPWAAACSEHVAAEVVAYEIYRTSAPFGTADLDPPG